MELSRRRGGSKSKRSLRCDYERLLMVFLGLMGAFLLAVNLSLVALEQANYNAPTASSSSRSNRSKPDKQPLLDILRLARTHKLTDEEWESLPSWEQVVQRFGDKPRIIGLETCQSYRDQVKPDDRAVGPSGMFNTGTNLLFELLNKNCRIRPPSAKAPTKNHGMLWQVNWGKHQYSRFRHSNKVHSDSNIRNSAVFPIVMVRDPWTWLQSLCKVRYSTHWFHGTC